MDARLTRIRGHDILNRRGDEAALERIDSIVRELGEIRASITEAYSALATSIGAVVERTQQLEARTASASSDLSIIQYAASQDEIALAKYQILLNAQVGDLQATTSVLAEAFVDSETGDVISRFGFNLSAYGVVTSMEAIAQNGPTGPISEIVFGDTTSLRSEDFESGLSGWSIDGDGNAEFNRVVIRDALITSSLAQPSIDPAGGLFSSSVVLSVAVVSGLTLRYTVDGSDVKDDSPEWPIYAGGYSTLTLTSSTVIKARCFDGAGRMSSQVSNTYTKNDTTPKCASPVIYAAGGVIVMVSATAGATIYYSTDGGATYDTYTSPVPATPSTGYLAYASAVGYDDSSPNYFFNIA